MSLPAWVLLGLGCAVAMMAASRMAVRHAVALTERLGVPPFLVGLTLVAIGTDTPEIMNSLVSSCLGHGDINVGDSIGSVFTQGTLVLGLFPFILGSALPVDRREILPAAGLTAAALLAGSWLCSDGFLARTDALLLILAWAGATWVLFHASRKTTSPAEPSGATRHAAVHGALALAALAAVGLAAGGLVKAVMTVAGSLGVSEYVLSFFGASLGTSLPELVVEFTAIRNGKRELALGDLLGSCLVDASLSIGAGPLLFPTAVTAHSAVRGSALALLATGLMAWTGLRGRLDRPGGAVLIVAYLLAYLFLLAPQGDTPISPASGSPAHGPPPRATDAAPRAAEAP